MTNMNIQLLKITKTLAALLLCYFSQPLLATPSLEHGKKLFRLCVACHGNQGEGIERLGAPAIAGMQDWYILNQLKSYRAGARGLHPKDLAGQRMRPMARTLNNDTHVEDVAAYVASLPAPQLPRTLKGRPLLGKAAFEATCVACHGADAKGNKAMNAPSLTQTSDWYLLTQLKNFKHGVRGSTLGKDGAADPFGAMMAPMAAGLDEETMMDIIFYIQSLR